MKLENLTIKIWNVPGGLGLCPLNKKFGYAYLEMKEKDCVVR